MNFGSIEYQTRTNFKRKEKRAKIANAKLAVELAAMDAQLARRLKANEKRERFWSGRAEVAVQRARARGAPPSARAR